MAKLDFKLNIEKEINKNIDIKPFLMIFILLFLPIFYSLWTIYDYNKYSLELKKVEEILINKNLQLKTMEKKIKRYSLKPQITKNLINQNYVNDYKIKKDIFSKKSDEVELLIDCLVKIPHFLCSINIENKKFDLNINAKTYNSKLSSKSNEIELNSYSEEYLIKKQKKGFFNNLFYSKPLEEKIVVKFKKQNINFNVKTQTNEIKIDSLNSFNINVGTREIIITYNKKTKEISLPPIVGKLIINTKTPENMLFPIIKQRNKKYLQLKNRLKNLRLFKLKTADLPLKKLMEIGVIKDKKIEPIKLKFYKDDDNKLLLKATFSTKKYSNFKIFTKELKKKNIFNNLEILSFTNKNKILTMDILISVNMEEIDD